MDVYDIQACACVALDIKYFKERRDFFQFVLQVDIAIIDSKQ